MMVLNIKLPLLDTYSVQILFTFPSRLITSFIVLLKSYFLQCDLLPLFSKVGLINKK